MDYTIAINERMAMLAERTCLNQLISDEREDYKKNLADKEREKIQAMDNLKKGN